MLSSTPSMRQVGDNKYRQYPPHSVHSPTYMLLFTLSYSNSEFLLVDAKAETAIQKVDSLFSLPETLQS